MSKTLVLIAGRRKSGKDTFAKMLAAELYNALRAPQIGDGATLSVNADGDLIGRGPVVVDQITGLTAVATSEPIDLRDGLGDDSVINHMGARLLHYASPLKRFCVDVLGLDEDLVWGSDEDKNTLTRITRPYCNFRGEMVFRKGESNSPKMTIREVLQFVGTDIVRELNPDAWIQAMCRRFAQVPEPFVLVPDCRFHNELAVEEFIPMDTTIIRVLLLRRAVEDTHESEQYVAGFAKHRPELFSAVLPQDATLEDMSKAARAITSSLIGATTCITITPNQFVDEGGQFDVNKVPPITL